MKRLILSIALLGVLAPAAAFAGSGKLSEEGIGRVSKTASGGNGGAASGAINAEGTYRGQPMTGTFSARFSADWSKGSKGCTTAGGEVNLVGKNPANSLTLTETGRLCKAANSSYRFTGSYSITLGTGIFATDGVGTGKASFVLTKDGKMHLIHRGALHMIERPRV